MSRTQTLVQLTDTLIAALDQRAAQRGVSRSQVIREAVEAHLDADHQGEVSRRIMAGYERVPQSEPDAWGDPTTVLEARARDLHRRVDAEEETAGAEPW